MRDRSYSEVMTEAFRRDPAYAVGLFSNVLQDGDELEITTTLHLLSSAFGDASIPMPSDDCPPRELYRTLFPEEKPPFASLSAILRKMNLRLAVVPLTPAPAAPDPEKHAEHPEPVMA